MFGMSGTQEKGTGMRENIEPGEDVYTGHKVDIYLKKTQAGETLVKLMMDGQPYYLEPHSAREVGEQLYKAGCRADDY